jgi:hypothetical protein
MVLIHISTLVIDPPTPSGASFVVEAVAFGATHLICDGCSILVAVFLSLAGLDVMFCWKVKSARVTVGVDGGVTTFEVLPIG